MEIRTLLVGDMQVNCYLLWAQKDRTLVLDPGDEAEAILHALRNNGLTVQAVVLVFEGKVIGGDLDTVELDGFLTGFAGPVENPAEESFSAEESSSVEESAPQRRAE